MRRLRERIQRSPRKSRISGIGFLLMGTLFILGGISVATYR
jgi:hypothetical protein